MAAVYRDKQFPTVLNMPTISYCTVLKGNLESIFTVTQSLSECFSTPVFILFQRERETSESPNVASLSLLPPSPSSTCIFQLIWGEVGTNYLLAKPKEQQDIYLPLCESGKNSIFLQKVMVSHSQ